MQHQLVRDPSAGHRISRHFKMTAEVKRVLRAEATESALSPDYDRKKEMFARAINRKSATPAHSPTDHENLASTTDFEPSLQLPATTSRHSMPQPAC